MKKYILTVSITIASFLLLHSSLEAQQNKIGIFNGHSDVGTPLMPGAATYIAQTQQYVISGAGANVWADHDEFQYVYKKMSGDFILFTRAEFLGSWVNYHRKAGWMIRKNLDSNAPQVNAVEHGDGLTSFAIPQNSGRPNGRAKNEPHQSQYFTA